MKIMTAIITSPPVSSQRTKAAKLMFTPVTLQNQRRSLSIICSPLCARPTKLKFRPTCTFSAHLCSFIPFSFLFFLCQISGRQLHVLSVRAFHRAAGFCHPQHHGGIRLVHLFHRHHVLSRLPGLCHQGNGTQPRRARTNNQDAKARRHTTVIN